MDLVLKFLDAHAASFVWGFAAFFVFVVVIYRFGVSAIIKAVDAREERIRGQLAEAEQTYAKAKQVQAELDAQMKSAEGKIQAMMAEARRDAEAHKAELVEKGRTEIEALKHRAARELEAARHAALIGLRADIAALSTQVAETVLREKVDAARQDQLTGQAIDAFATRLKDGGR